MAYKTLTLKQEMETADRHATMRESFSLIQKILFIEYADIIPAHSRNIWLKRRRKRTLEGTPGVLIFVN